nr:zeta toxin family protein [Streptomyces coryli]
MPADRQQQILHRQILPRALAGAVRQDRPVVVFVAGQPGAGKSTAGGWICKALSARGGAVQISRDKYRPDHPDYPQLLQADDREAGARVRPVVSRWQDNLETQVRARGVDAVVETTLADLEAFRTAAPAWRAAGYRIELVVVAVPDAVSQLAVLHRYLAQVTTEGTGRFVGWQNHDAASTALEDAVRVVESEQLADRIAVVRRDLQPLFTNELAAGHWRHPVGAGTAVAAERKRPWTATETRRFRGQQATVERQLARAPQPEEREVAVRPALERASAFAEPVKRQARIKPGRPGVRFLGLSAAEHKDTFDNAIVPGMLEPITPTERPRVVYVLGQPGAGKADVAGLVRRSLDLQGVTHLVGEHFKSLHPDYLELLKDDPRSAGAAIRDDYRAWMTQSEAYVRARRGNVTIEIAPGDAGEFWASALPFHQAGYRVEVVALAVREADSRQATAHRYALAVGMGLPGRFTSQAGHDTCFQAVPDVIAAVAAHPSVAAVTIINREGQALWRHEGAAAGPGAGPGAGAGRLVWSLLAERMRPYTDGEAERFLALQRRLRQELPQYRDELDDIAALARPLMPTWLLPPRLPQPGPATWLPLPASDYSPSTSSVCRAA